ncbi:MAG: PEP-utilizing enzyme [bacterium]|nr:PEP-utilizing enzyme [bacterium]
MERTVPFVVEWDRRLNERSPMPRELLRGVPAAAGRAVGPAAHVVRELTEPSSPPRTAGDGSPDLEAECSALCHAAKAVRHRLEERAANAKGVARSVLEMSAVMAEDPTLLRESQALVREQGLGAAAAVWRAGRELALRLEAVGGPTAERAADVLDVRDRVVADLLGQPVPGIPELDHPYVLVADDLAPSDTAILDPAMVLAIVTAQGGPTSHTAILARELGIPAVVSAEGCLAIPEGSRIGVDGSGGRVWLAVEDEEEFLSHRPPAFEYRGPGATADGFRVDLMANVGDGEGARLAAQVGADGIGLLRTEYCFPPTMNPPSIEEQAAKYGEVFAAFPGRRVVVRTLDAGADKPLPYLTHLNEPNPALGVRGIRAMEGHPEVLEQQLEAIRLAAEANEAEVWVMAPMVATADEAEDFVAGVHAAGLPTAGVMIEIPAAAVRASHLLARADFASVGTNDLAQYAMAADRTLGELAQLTDTWDPAVLSLIRMAAQGGEQQGRPVGVCGEAAADPALGAVLVGLGISSLSTSPRMLPAVAAVLSRTTRAECVRLAETALSQDSAAAARDAVRAELPVLEELGL